MFVQSELAARDPTLTERSPNYNDAHMFNYDPQGYYDKWGHPANEVQLGRNPWCGNQPGGSVGKQLYRIQEPSPTSAARIRQMHNQPGQLRIIQFDYQENIKHLEAAAAPPSHGPSIIRGWSHQVVESERFGKIT
jgi:hypothetical protein